jgi:hypothetical protein
VAVAYVAGISMAAVDLQIVNVALPTLGRAFHASIASVQWTVLGYALRRSFKMSGVVGSRGLRRRV